MIYWTNLTRRLTGMMRRLTISPGGAPTNVQKRNLSKKAAERVRGRTPKRLSGRLRDRSALDFSFSFVCGAGVCLSRRAQRADLYKTSTRHGAKNMKTPAKIADHIENFAILCYNIINKCSNHLNRFVLPTTICMKAPENGNGEINGSYKA